MVKFSKELEAQLIPEWKEAFVNYWKLKKHVKKIKLLWKLPKQRPPHGHPEIFGRSIFDPVRCIAAKFASRKPQMDMAAVHQVNCKGVESDSNDNDDDEEQQQPQKGGGGGGGGHHHHQQQQQQQQSEINEFFEKLDLELNKVNQFYETKEVEFLERGENLRRQLEILVDLKQLISNRRRKSAAAGSLPHSLSSSVLSSGSDYSSDSSLDNTTPASNNAVVVAGTTWAKTKHGKPAAAGRAINNVTTLMLWEDVANSPKKGGPGEYVNRKKVQCAEKMIRGAFVELYKGLGLMITYSSLNLQAFIKILKKFDKVSSQQASATYLKAVKRSHFISSDKVARLMDEVECIFTKHFANGDRKKAMKFLRPQQKKESHMVTFFVGLLTGCFVTLFAVYAILAYLAGMFSEHTQAEAAYMETVYPVFSMFALLSLHIFMYGCNLFMWKSTRINYNFIFEFSSPTALKYRDAFLICTSFMTAVVGAMVVHLMLLDNGVPPSQVDTIPGMLLLVFITLLICPLNILYRPTRYCFLRVLRNIVFSPFYKVLMVDFFMADQLTSQIPLLRQMESTACYFLAGSFKINQFGSCKNGKLFRELAYVISFLPYYWRAMQCARRWFDEYDVNHLANLGKYVSAMVAAGARLTYARQPTELWLVIVVVTSVIATLYQLYWDFVKDWGLLNLNSRNPWLRDDLILKNKNIYYISIAFNLVLRVAWVETVTGLRVGDFETRMLEFLLASLEVIRRGQWNFYRLENEHLNNVGKFRAVKTVPLPFRETDSDG